MSYAAIQQRCWKFARCILLAFLGTLIGTLNDARADQAADAAVFVRAFSERTVALLSTPANAPQERVEALRGLVLEGLEIEAISRFVLGRSWGDANETDRSDYRRAYEEYIVRSLAQRLTNYGGETLIVGATRPMAGGDVLVGSTLARPAGAPIKIDWRLRPTAEGFRIVDLIVEGLSLVVTQRDEFAAVLRGGGLPALVKTLRQRSASL